MVSKASDDFPEPLNPVMTVKVLRGIETSMFFRLCCRAPCTVMRSSKNPIFPWAARGGGGLRACGRIGFVLLIWRRRLDQGVQRGRGRPPPSFAVAGEFLEGSVKGSFDAGFLSRKSFERVGAGALSAVAGDDQVGRVGELLFSFPLVSLNLEDALRVDGAFEDARAAEAPGGNDHLVDQERFVVISGGVVVAKGCRMGIEILRAFRSNEHLRGGEAVFEGVATGFGFAFRGFGAGAELGVAAIGFVLFFGCHARGVTRRSRRGGRGLVGSG